MKQALIRYLISGHLQLRVQPPPLTGGIRNNNELPQKGAGLL